MPRDCGLLAGRHGAFGLPQVHVVQPELGDPVLVSGGIQFEQFLQLSAVMRRDELRDGLFQYLVLGIGENRFQICQVL